MPSLDEELTAGRATAIARVQRELAEAQVPKGSLANERINFLTKLIEARQRQHLSQTELAEKLGWQQSAIARIEGKHGNPSLNTLLTIAKALDVQLMVK